MTWTKLNDTNMRYQVYEMMSDHRLKYHNFGHILDLYTQAEKWKVPYCPDLDCAILWHDSVYDAHPNKELRSIDALRAYALSNPLEFKNINVHRACEMIATTIDHKLRIDGDNVLLMLDLAALRIPEQAQANFWKIMEESKALYGINNRDAAQGTVDFMSRFINTVNVNYAIAQSIESEFKTDPHFYWNLVERGVNTTKTMAETIVYMYDNKMVK